ncbi:MAG: polymer-forming cytoskeletal protein [Bacteroidales bacterium]|nr:polymer-forming cytoskeletal protein [Bacteroidales bacterium]
MVKLYDGVEAPEINTIAAGTKIEGNVTTTSDCRIDGIIKGNIECKAKVVIGPNGILEGDIVCESAEIEGKVKANISATDLISLRSTAVLAGDITSSKLSIEPGATFMGNCKIQSGRAVATPVQPESNND